MSARTLAERIDEVVIGLADDTERAEIEALARRDPQVAARLAMARERYGELDATADEIPLPAHMWDRISERLDGDRENPDGDTSLDEDDTTNVVPLTPPETPLPGAGRRWRATALGGLAASLMLAIALGWSLLIAPQPVVVAVLLDAANQPVALVEGASDNTTWITLLGRTRVPGDRVMQVWTKPADDGPPVSLGLLEAQKGARFKVDGLPPPRPDQLYEITFEPPGGSPTDRPTGPIHGKGLARQPI